MAPPRNRADYRDLPPKIHRLEPPNQPENSRDEEAYYKASNNGKIKTTMLAAYGDITGKPAKSQSGKIRPQQTRCHQNQAKHNQETTHYLLPPARSKPTNEPMIRPLSTRVNSACAPADRTLAPPFHEPSVGMRAP